MCSFFTWNQELPQDTSSVDRKIEQGPYTSQKPSLPQTLHTQCSPCENDLSPLNPNTWKKPTMTKGLDFTKFVTSSVLLNKGALWRICLLNQTTKAVDSTTSEERHLKESHQNFPEFNEQKFLVLNSTLCRLKAVSPFSFSSKLQDMTVLTAAKCHRPFTTPKTLYWVLCLH